MLLKFGPVVIVLARKGVRVTQFAITRSLPRNLYDSKRVKMSHKCLAAVRGLCWLRLFTPAVGTKHEGAKDSGTGLRGFFCFLSECDLRHGH